MPASRNLSGKVVASMAICYIFGSGEYGEQWPVLEENAFVIAADGGYAQLRRHGILPHLLVGDFDSLGYVPEHPHIVRHPVIKDDTDTALAISEGWKRGYRTFHIYGGLGGRLDHTLANLQLLVGLAERGGAGFLLGEDNAATAVCGGSLTFPAGYEDNLSVFAANGPAEGVDLTGLFYPLEDARLTGDVPLGVSNQFLPGQSARISVERGTVLVLWRPQGGRTLPGHEKPGQ